MDNYKRLIEISNDILNYISKNNTKNSTEVKNYFTNIYIKKKDIILMNTALECNEEIIVLLEKNSQS